MSWTDIASMIAAIAFAVLVLALVYPLFQLGKTFQQTAKSVAELTDSLEETVQASTEAVKSANSSLEKVDTITSSAANAVADASALSTLVTASLGSPLVKLTAFSRSARQVASREKSMKDFKATYRTEANNLRSAILDAQN
ncbi:hypothetical protein BK816_04280 [Boudabousia tangfeifanii]|uniref:DUF948 domain-containing protein n=1 Tax=Boudabousia tangfeifanii TaxID=1912795 RepID=A0A1D9MKA0_9ACTO|nr:DUF948 domain-containing protein [Boudabousia tangfeifanii]AOZ72609.1 hypothetical protein BK816_04280 [Boudabousia tangfeifanii]